MFAATLSILIISHVTGLIQTMLLQGHSHQNRILRIYLFPYNSMQIKLPKP